jgi:hypothetical protein
VGTAAKPTRENRTITIDLHDEATYFRLINDGRAAASRVTPKPGGSQRAFLTGLAHLYNLIPYQRRAKHAGQCGVEGAGGRLPTADWFLNLPILTSGGFRGAGTHSTTKFGGMCFFHTPRTLARPSWPPVSRATTGASARQLHGAWMAPCSRGSGSTRRWREGANAHVPGAGGRLPGAHALCPPP